jgi:hypothetical protein|tara:strand:- start:1460 stop:1663 length:204 start_codon:yes stop_codon:yes gene_type:complete
MKVVILKNTKYKITFVIPEQKYIYESDTGDLTLAVSESKVKFLEEVSKEELLESSIYEYELLVDKDN